MAFLYPSFLWALLALAIPIIIHLFYFKRFKKVYFTNVKFLKEVKEETSSRSRLKNLLTLLMRLLAMAALILAFAQPFLPSGKEVNQGRKGVSVFVDNSYSMNALSKDVSLFDKAKDKARDIINSYSQEDKFQILTHDFEARHQRLLSQEDALSYIDEITVTPTVNELSKALTKQKKALDKEDNKLIYLISDFQNNISDIELDADTTISYNMIALQSIQEKNVSIDSAWFSAPVPMINQANEMIVKISNYSNDDTEDVELSLLYDGQTRPLGVKSIKANSVAYDTINLSILKTGWQTAEITISDYPVQFDDNYKFAFNVKELVKVLSIDNSGSNKYLNAAFKGLTYFQIENQSANKLQYAEFTKYDLIVLNDLRSVSTGLGSALQQYVINGGNVLVFPGADIDMDSYNAFLSMVGANTYVEKKKEPREVGSINTSEFIFSDVFERQQQNIKLPKVTMSYISNNFVARGGESLLKFRDGTNFITKYVKEGGHCYVAASPLGVEESDLVRNAEIFIPMLYKMSIYKGKKQAISYVIGEDQIIDTDAADNTGSEVLYKISGAEEFIPGKINVGNKVMLDINDQIKESGFYDLSLGDQALGKLAFNFNRKESDLSYMTVSELKSKYGDQASILSDVETASMSEFITKNNAGTQLWRWCIILVLVFLALETLILRFWKT